MAFGGKSARRRSCHEGDAELRRTATKLIHSRLLLTAAGLLALAPTAALALDPARGIAQYKHTRWTIEDGAPSSINVLAQSADGYLWITSPQGVYRFDGVVFERIDTPDFANSASPGGLLAARDGSVWVAFGSQGIGIYRHGRFENAGLPSLPNAVTDLAQTRDGTVWAAIGRRQHNLARYAGGKWQLLGAESGLPDQNILAMRPARDGSLWIGTTGTILVLRPGSHRFTTVSTSFAGRAGLTEDRAGRIWLSDDKGSRVISGATNAHPLAYPTPGAERQPRTLFDRDGNLWGISSTTGIFRLAAPDPSGARSPAAAAAAVARYGAADGLSSDLTKEIFEDREGNIWVASSLGLDRFRAASVVQEPALARPSNDGDALASDGHGNVYIGTDDGLYIVAPGGAPKLLLRDSLSAICRAPDGTVWAIIQKAIIHFIPGGTQRLAPPRMEEGIYECGVDGAGTLWLAAGSDGIFRRRGEGWQHFPASANGDALMADNVAIGSRGTPVFNSYTGTLVRVGPSGPFNLFGEGRYVMPRVYAMHQAPHGLLLGTTKGLARLAGGRVQWITKTDQPLFTALHGFAETSRGETWLVGIPGILRLRTAELDHAFANPRAPLNARLFDLRDGLPNLVPEAVRDAVVEGGDGRLWFDTKAGAVWIDPAHIPFNPLPPPVAIGGLVADGIRYLDPARVALPAGSANLEIDYSALSLSIPERVQFRYRLEGVDPDWVNPGTRRQAFYTNLGPGHYRFQVIASNNDGVWNKTGATLEFDIAPTFFQSIWFTLLCLLVAGAAMWGAYTLRLRQLAGRMRARLEARLAERERIARELHDTLLQGFQGLMLRFQSVAERLPPDQPVRLLLDQALDRADTVLAEGRDRVRALRAAERTSLADRIADAADALVADHAASFRLTIEGTPRPLHPMVADESAGIAGEAIRNAFRHAEAKEVEAILVFGSKALRLGVHDDGKGIPDDIAAAGERPGHYGLTGMRERAARIGATLEIRSRPGAGTEILLNVPATTAYADAGGGRWRRWRRLWTAKGWDQ